MAIQSRRGLALLAFKLWDCLLVLAVVFASTRAFLPAAVPWPVALELPPGLVLIGIALSWHLILMAYGLYDSRRLDDPSRERMDILRSANLATALVAIASILFEWKFVTAGFIGVFWLLLVFSTGLSRVAMRSLLARLRERGHNLRFALIIGCGPRGCRLERFLSQPELGYRVVGFAEHDQELAASQKHSAPVLGSFEDLPAILGRTVVDEVFFALPIRSFHDRMQLLLGYCEQQGVTVVLPGDLFRQQLSKLRPLQLGDTPSLRLHSTRDSQWRQVFKRGLDVSVSTVVLVLLSPLLLCTVLAVKWTSPGPAIFRQVRVGLNKRTFTLYKFRTMGIGAEQHIDALSQQNETDGPAFKMRNDPRVTPFGSFLRRTSIDELPQLINVLRGDMSLVGPRPLPLRDVAGFQQNWHRRRFSVKPGITCLWQLSGRSNLSFEKWMELDLQYIDSWSLRLDLSILLRTITVVLKREGAY